jgi:hypothetical protein
LAALEETATHDWPPAGTGTAARELLDLLGTAGLLDHAGGQRAGADGDRDIDDAAALPPLSPIERDRLRPDLAAVSLATRDPDGARRVLARRRLAGVQVRGGGRVGAQVAALLAAAGVGRVVVDDAGITGPGDLAPGGLGRADLGRPRAVAAMAALNRVTPAPVPSSDVASPYRPDLLVLAPVGLPVVRPDESLALERGGVAHLLAGVRETTGVVGPLVVPGSTPCLHCQHLSRFAADSAWPLLALQLARRAQAGLDACDVTLATLVGALATAQVLAFLDAGHARAAATAPADTAPADTTAPAETTPADTADWPPMGPAGASHSAPSPPLPATAGGTLEIATPDWRIRRRTWPLHPDCPCRAARAAAATSPPPPPDAILR